MILADGYDKRKNPSRAEYRRMTLEEAKALTYGQTLRFLANDGTARHIRVNGKVRTWKRDPNRVEIPMKYGFNEYATFSWCEASWDSRRAMRHHGCELLVFVRDVGDPIPASEVGL